MTAHDKNCGLKKKQLRNMYKNILIVCNAITLNSDSNIRIILVAIFAFNVSILKALLYWEKLHTLNLYMSL